MNYDKDYYEHGIETGKSCYQNYRWIPELTIPLAMTIIDFLKIDRNQTVLDYGCAKGFLVKALRLLHRKAWGVDISEYAISCSEKYCWLTNDDAIQLTLPEHKKIYGFPDKFDWIIAKDVFEHISSVEELGLILNNMSSVTNRIFAIIPLGEDGVFVAESNNFDKSHKLCFNADEWGIIFNKFGWGVVDKRYQIDGIKDAYYDKYPKGHGFFTLSKGGQT